MIIASDIPKHKPATEGGKAMKAIEMREIGDPNAEALAPVP
jgi:hypothetical protein